MGAKVKNRVNPFRWAAITGASCGVGWLALYALLRLFGVQNPTAPTVVSTAAPAIIILTIWIIGAIKQGDTPNQPIWTWIMFYRKFVIALLVVAFFILVVLAAVAIDETIASGETRMLIGIAVILAIVGAILGGLMANFDFARLRNSR